MGNPGLNNKRGSNKELTLLAVLVTIVVAASAIYFAGCTKEQPMPTLPEGYNWYDNDEFGYKIAYPESWTVVPQEMMLLTEGMEYAQAFEEPDKHIAFAVLIFSEYPIEELKATGAKDVVINGREGYELIDQPVAGVKLKIVAFAVNDKYYLVTCRTSADLWDEYAATFDNAINSFVIE